MRGINRRHLLKPVGLVFALAANLSFAGVEELNLIPWPATVEVKPGEFVLTEKTVVVTDAAFTNEAALLLPPLRSATGLPLSLTPNTSASSAIRLLKAPENTSVSEAYTLEVTPEQVTLRAAEPVGMFRAVQTLLQLFPPSGKNTRLPAVVIEDEPRFAWRGLMLDCSRTFQSVEYLKQTLDRMAVYKLNVLHLHLTDDQGWRLEIKKYPELTAKGSSFPAKYNEPPEHQGYYTQEQMRELVAYAAARHITIVPEIEMPGHSLAAMSVMPHLSCTGGPFEIYPFFKGPGFTKDIFCAGKEETFAFFSDVLAEVIEIFPSTFIHIGGDEALKDRWKSCPLCQKRIQDEGLKNEAELQSWFTHRIEKMITAKGRRLIGWDEILEGGLSPTAAVMSWRGTKGGIAAAKEGHDVVMTPRPYCYLSDPYGWINSARAFSFDPLADLPPDAARGIKGLQACFWTDNYREPERLDEKLYPRLLALAERAWSPATDTDEKDYLRRARAHVPRLESLGINPWAWDLVEPAGEWVLKNIKMNSLEFDVTARMTVAGEYQVMPLFCRGDGTLSIHAVELLRGDEVVAQDRHEGAVSSKQSQNETYTLSVPAVHSGTTYTLRLAVTGTGGSNSWGRVLFKCPSE